MKRQAEEQLTKGDDDQENSGDQQEPGRGVHRAHHSDLASRNMRPLPRRAGVKSPQPTASETALPTLNSSSLSSFSSSTNPNPFGLTPAPSTTSSFTNFSFKAAEGQSKTATTNNAFSLASSSGSALSFTFKPSESTPSVAPNATNTSKAFASLLNSASTNTFGAPASASQLPSAATASTPSKIQDESVPMKYYTNLRGLNMSILAAISKLIEEDPYTDLTTVLEKYNSFRLKIQKDFDDSGSSSAKPGPPSTPLSTPQNDKPAMPTPPPSFSGFGNLKSSNSSVPSTTNSPSAPTSTSSNLFTFKPSSPGFGPSNATNPFALPTDSKPSSISTPAPSSSFTFGGPEKSSLAHGSTFGSFGSPASSFGATMGSTSSQPSTTASNPFGSATTSPLVFGRPAETSATAAATSNPFGGTGKTPSAFPPAASPKPSGSSSIHFGFGSSSSNTTFGKSESSVAPATSTEENTTEGESSERGTPAADDGSATPGLLTPNPLDEEGAGEENEETVHGVKSKAYYLSKPDAEGGAKWLQLGSGILRLKKHKDTGARRVLLRNSTNGKVIVNFKIYSGLKPTQQKSALSFVGHDNGVPQTYSIRLANEGDAKNLKEALEKEIAFVKAKEAS